MIEGEWLQYRYAFPGSTSHDAMIFHGIKVKVLILSVVVTLLAFAHISYAESLPAPKAVSYAEKMTLWLDKLEKAESNDNPKLNELDINGRYSRGCLQFQDWTWKHYSRRYKIEGTQFDCQSERDLAVAMVQGKYRLYRSWLTSVRRIGLPPIQE